ncbi:hypothetical protein IG631_11397 [Alternaria alternata]|nr:hypothetical protein IG631_11397 [Alternaria alternata]
MHATTTFASVILQGPLTTSQKCHCTAIFSVEEKISALLSTCTSQEGAPIGVSGEPPLQLCTAISSVEENVTALLSACMIPRGRNMVALQSLAWKRGSQPRA